MLVSVERVGKQYRVYSIEYRVKKEKKKCEKDSG